MKSGESGGVEVSVQIGEGHSLRQLHGERAVEPALVDHRRLPAPAGVGVEDVLGRGPQLTLGEVVGVLASWCGHTGERVEDVHLAFGLPQGVQDVAHPQRHGSPVAAEFDHSASAATAVHTVELVSGHAESVGADRTGVFLEEPCAELIHRRSPPVDEGVSE